MKEMNEKELPKLRRGGLFVVALVLLIFVLLDAFRILSMGAYQGSLALIGVVISCDESHSPEKRK